MTQGTKNFLNISKETKIILRYLTPSSSRDHTPGEGYSLVYEQARVPKQHLERLPACGRSGPHTVVGRDEQEQLVQGPLACLLRCSLDSIPRHCVN